MADPTPTYNAARDPDIKHNSVAGHHRDDTDSSAETAVGSSSIDEILSCRVELAKDRILPCLIQPSEEEAIHYYHGICSSPHLVGRASAGLIPYQTIEEQKEAWQRDPERSAWFTLKEKTITNIGSHGIRTKWDSIEPTIKEAVRNLPWTSLDVIRLGDTEEPHANRPVTVWVGLEHSNIPWPRVAEALRDARFVLDENSLLDVDVQLRVSQVFSLTSRPPLLSVTHGSAEAPPDNVLLPFTTSIGNPISPCARPTLVGTLGVYISPSAAGNTGAEQDTPPVWAITCRHVGLPSSLNQDNRLFHSPADDDAEPPKFFMPSDETTMSSIDGLKYFRDRQESLAKSSGLEKDNALLLQADEAYRKALVFRDRDARVSGTVYLSPPIAAAQSAVLWTKDYCLLKMDKAKFPAGEDVTNTLDISKQLQDIFFTNDLIRSQRVNQPDFNFPGDGLIKIQGLIPLSEIQSPPDLVENHRGQPCIIVMKKGAATGLTFGCPSELLSTVRKCMPDGSVIDTREWAILGSFENKKVAFSKSGDSGAAVLGLDGRLGGFLTRGAGADLGMSIDITYASPAVLVLEDIEKELGFPVKIL